MSGIEVASLGAVPITVDNAPLDHNCLHCQLALPVQHFIGKHPEKSREDLIREACELVAELVAACGHDAQSVKPYGKYARERLAELIEVKIRAHDLVRRQGRGLRPGILARPRG